MERKLRARLDSLPKMEASFIEPMECLSVSKLPGGNQWVWEILCSPPHNFFCGGERYVALTLIGDVAQGKVCRKAPHNLKRGSSLLLVLALVFIAFAAR